MRSYNANSADCLVFTFKEGLLSPIAHDLCIRVTDWQLDVDDGPPISLRASADATSLRVETAMREGSPLPNALTAADLRKIEQNIREDVLHTSRYPSISLASRAIREIDGGYELRGDLTLHGATHEVVVPIARREGRLVARLPIHQPDFAIKPYRAMLGTLRIQADLYVEVSLPA